MQSLFNQSVKTSWSCGTSSIITLLKDGDLHSLCDIFNIGNWIGVVDAFHDKCRNSATEVVSSVYLLIA